MVTVESAAVGTPAICGNGAGALLADATIAALGNPAQMNAWSVAGRAMSADFAIDRVAEQLVALFEQARTEH